MILQKILAFKKLREKVLFELKNEYYHELSISIPIGNGFWAHLSEKDAFDSFSEIFIDKEYLDFIPEQVPKKVIDLGSHYGYFSLWLQSVYPDEKLNILMIEPSARCRNALSLLQEYKILEGRFIYLAKGIGNPNDERIAFYERPFMSSSTNPNEGIENPKTVPVLKIKDIAQNLKPPYDLIKCDIEGSEWDFLEHYKPIIRESKTIIMEWHSWHAGGGGFAQIESKIKELGFSIDKVTDASKAELLNGEVGLLRASNNNFK